MIEIIKNIIKDTSTIDQIRFIFENKSMSIYIGGAVLTAILLALSQLFKNLHDKCDNNKIIYNCFHYFFFILSIFPLAIISGIREHVGTDQFGGYYSAWQYILNGGGRFPSFELGFEWIIRFIQFITKDYAWFCIITSFIFNTFLCLSIRKMSKSWWISGLMIVLGNFFFISLNNIRQCCAMAVITYAYTFIVDKKYIRGLFFSFVAVFFFHTSVIVVVPLFVIFSIKKIRFLYPVIIIIGIIGIPWYMDFAFWLSEIIGYSDYWGNHMITKPLYPYLLLHFGVFITTLFMYKKISNEDNYGFGLLVLNFITVLISIESFKYPVNEIMSRACLSFSWSVIFLIPYLKNVTKYKVVNYICIILLLIVAYRCTFTTSVYLGHHEVFPYQTIFDVRKG